MSKSSATCPPSRLITAIFVGVLVNVWTTRIEICFVSPANETFVERLPVWLLISVLWHFYVLPSRLWHQMSQVAIFVRLPPIEPWKQRLPFKQNPKRSLLCTLARASSSRLSSSMNSESKTCTNAFVVDGTFPLFIFHSFRKFPEQSLNVLSTNKFSWEVETWVFF